MDFPQDDIWAEKILLSLCPVKLNGETGSACAVALVRLRSGLCVRHVASAGLRASPAWSVLHSPVLGLLKDGDQWAASAWPRGRPAVAHTVPAAGRPPCSVTQSSAASQARAAAGARSDGHPGQGERVWRHRGKGRRLAPEPGKLPGSASGQSTPWRGLGFAPQAPGSLSWWTEGALGVPVREGAGKPG